MSNSHTSASKLIVVLGALISAPLFAQTTTTLGDIADMQLTIYVNELRAKVAETQAAVEVRTAPATPVAQPVFVPPKPNPEMEDSVSVGDITHFNGVSSANLTINGVQHRGASVGTVYNQWEVIAINDNSVVVRFAKKKGGGRSLTLRPVAEAAPRSSSSGPLPPLPPLTLK